MIPNLNPPPLPRPALVLAVLMLLTNVPAQTSAKISPGLVTTYTVENAADTAVTPNVWFYLPAGQPPTPFLPAGKVSAVWDGFINADLRGDFFFRAELSGTLKLEVNGAVALEAGGDGRQPSAPTKAVRLNKGANALKATFTSPAQGDAFVRLEWSEKAVLWEPVPLTMLTHGDNAGLAQADKLRLGRQLFVEHRCAKCHAGPATGMPELAPDAPDFEDIGSRRSRAWMTKWILDPKAQRVAAHMPKIFHGAKAGERAAAVAAWLASLQAGTKAPAAESGAELISAGRTLAEKLHCAGCHNLPEAGAADAVKISLKHVREKFPPGQLAAFVQKPDAHYGWTRMPRFNLSNDEARQLAAWLNSAADAPPEITAPGDAAVIELGKKLAQTSGCLNCHTAKLDNQFKARPLTELAAAKWQEGCLAAAPKENATAPQFTFTGPEREALQAFAATDRASLTRHVPVEFAERQTRALNCAACHGQLEGFPALPILGGKLRPEWTRKFIAGELAYKPRHWLEHRMPAFPRYAEALAQGLALAHGLPPVTPAEPPADPALAKIGQKLVSNDGGFSCISCHSVGEQKATQVFESEGLNLAYPAERLQKSYFLRWVQNPLRVEPATKMPVYFDEEGKSPLADVLEGSAAKQIDAVWQYLRAGEKIQPPAAP